MNNIFFCIMLIFITACGGMEKNNTSPATWNHIKLAAKLAATDTITWLPLAGAGVIATVNLDEKISDSARKHNYLFDSQENANEVSDHLRDGCLYSGVLTELVRPTSNPRPWLAEKTLNLGLHATSLGLTSEVSGIIKERSKQTTQRWEPA